MDLSVASDSEGQIQLIKNNETLIETNRKLVEENLKIKDIVKGVNKVGNGKYFWNHGYKLEKWHKSETCPKNDRKHKDETTRGNTMGVSDKNKKWTEMGNKD